MTVQHVLGSITAPPGNEETDEIHRAIDNSRPPVVTIASGDEVSFDCPGLPLPRNATVEDVFKYIDPEHPHTIVGPVAVEDAEPGDTLVVEILDVALAQDYGHTVFLPGVGLLGEDVTEVHVQNFTWSEGDTHVELRPGVRVPLRPFCGQLLVAPAEPGVHKTMPPRNTGGNFDTRHLVPGSRLYLPVAVPGALFYCGDGHGAQGDGEVCVTGLETGVRATVRLSVDKGRTISRPEFHTPAPVSIDAGEHGWYAACGPGTDLYECAQNAVRGLIDYLVAERGLSWAEAYVLCSLAADLKINEIVNAPTWLVSAYLPLSVFADD